LDGGKSAEGSTAPDTQSEEASEAKKEKQQEETRHDQASRLALEIAPIMGHRLALEAMEQLIGDHLDYIDNPYPIYYPAEYESNLERWIFRFCIANERLPREAEEELMKAVLSRLEEDPLALDDSSELFSEGVWGEKSDTEPDDDALLPPFAKEQEPHNKALASGSVVNGSDGEFRVAGDKNALNQTEDSHGELVRTLRLCWE
jgi:hypothetical protein